MYAVGVTKEDKEEADSVFLKNMAILIDLHPIQMKWLRKKRMDMAKLYYDVVYFNGDEYFAKRTTGEVSYG
jgi:hypothetical protein